MNPTLPTFFVPHGSPFFALDPGAAGAALIAAAAALPQPRAIVIVSAHWDTAIPTVGFAQKLETIHDFWGFPGELYALRYPATGCPEASAEVVAALAAAGLPVERDPNRGLDHGAWIPLRLMFPDADVPVVPVSLQSAGGPQAAYRLGQALAPLVARGMLVVGSGNLTHNLRDLQLARSFGARTSSYVAEFSDWMAKRLADRDVPALLDYRRQAPGGAQAHPTDEHLLPLFVALGAAGNDAKVEHLHSGVDHFVIAMDAYSFVPTAGAQQ